MSRSASASSLLIGLGNLRGIRESGAIFTAPTYVYLVAIFGLLGYGLVRYALGDLPAYTAPAAWQEAHGTEALGLLLILRAFASGSVALTGTEAVSNGVPAFKPPEARHAQIVLILMGVVLRGDLPGDELPGRAAGHPAGPVRADDGRQPARPHLRRRGSPYLYLIQISTALLLVLAANTAFADFPRLAEHPGPGPLRAAPLRLSAATASPSPAASSC